jgi:ABC-2 type transport system ATP-binding protein
VSPVLELESLSKSFGSVNAVNQLSFAFEPGELVGLIGPNGAGKSTLIRCIAGLLQPDTGSVSIKGHDIWVEPYVTKRFIGYADQDPELFDYLSGRELLQFVSSVRREDGDAADNEVDRLLGLTNLQEDADRLIKQYSGGMKRKISLCTALIGSPPVLLLDEAFTGLDPESTAAIEKEVETRIEDDGTFVLFCSHMLDLLQRICDRFVILKDGGVISQFDDGQLEDRLAETKGLSSLSDVYLQETRGVYETSELVDG